MTAYPIISVEPSSRIGDEQMGTKPKFWWQDAEGTRWLFKYARANTGEHWSEKIAAEVATALDVPCAEVELAECEGEWGTVSRSFAQDGSITLVHGNELLQEVDQSYPVYQLRGVSKHTVPRVLSRLEPMRAPAPRSELPIAADWFVGYLMLDALIVNSDRHHENWGVAHVSAPEEFRCLAPSYDHASSLGRELLDSKRLVRLQTTDKRQSVEHYILRARSGFYADESAADLLHPTAAFRLACQLRPQAGKVWLARLEDMREDTLEGIVRRIPDSVITQTARAFAIRVLTTARGHILDRKTPPAQ